MKPSDMYLGISELFSVLIPGLLVSSVGLYIYVTQFCGNLDLNDIPKEFMALLWIVYGIISYIIGHVLFALGSKWDKIYDKYKPDGNEELLGIIEAARTEYCGVFDCATINKYQWCKALLSLKHPEGYSEVLRKEADSKLFRSLIAPSLLCSLVFVLMFNIFSFFISVLSLSVAWASYWRYKGQRFKACKLAYTHTIMWLTLKEVSEIESA